MPQLSQQSPLVRHWLYKLLKRPLNQVSSDLVWILRTCEEERKVSHEKNRKRKKKRWKVVKNRGGGIALVVGEDLQVSKVEELEGRAIVGKFYGRWMSFFTMEAWVDTHWSPNLGYSPTFHLLLRGWIGCVFWSKEDAVFILSNHRYWNRILFCGKPWHPLFDAREKALDNVLTWIKLPKLPSKFQSEKGLKAIGDTFGTFISVDGSYKNSRFHSILRILVELDPRQGLFWIARFDFGSKDL